MSQKSLKQYLIDEGLGERLRKTNPFDSKIIYILSKEAEVHLVDGKNPDTALVGISALLKIYTIEDSIEHESLMYRGSLGIKDNQIKKYEEDLDPISHLTYDEGGLFLKLYHACYKYAQDNSIHFLRNL